MIFGVTGSSPVGRPIFLYGRGTLVVQQSPKLPYEGAIPSVRANFFCVYADRYIRVCKVSSMLLRNWAITYLKDCVSLLGLRINAYKCIHLLEMFWKTCMAEGSNFE